ncbi:hypothetical protein [Saccharopolyspora phatthalungensis]|uniref:Uncharacterized protein n=1 Tax=Saccharopolyspora phatthalungensis TaxID=664693 RepID=A0A840Q917_9PSEU|nr:hypothetical protein [Saccharopolyspora phatthalungensis]MBB5159032.1 hypothetical protein [Saccharopolyspora phatthalungensis]
MPLTGVVLLVATALLVGALAVGLGAIIVLLARISRSLANASHNLGLIPEQFGPLGPAVLKYTRSLAGLRAEADSTQAIDHS